MWCPNHTLSHTGHLNHKHRIPQSASLSGNSPATFQQFVPSGHNIYLPSEIGHVAVPNHPRVVSNLAARPKDSHTF